MQFAIERNIQMADIISGNMRFNGNKNSRLVHRDDTQDDELIDVKIHRHKKRTRIIIIAAVAALIIAVLIGIFLSNSITYSSYSITKAVNRDDSSSSKYTEYNGGYIRYSNDGAAYYDSNGGQVWNKTFSMQKPQLKVCGDSVAIGDVNGNTIYIFNKSGEQGTVETQYKIAQVEVAGQGVVAAVLTDDTTNYINLYDKSGSIIYTVKTSLSGDGYPVDMSISEDGTKLVASYVYVGGEEMDTNIVFYNFSSVGQNETERVVGGFKDFGSIIAGDVQFISNSLAVAVGEDRMAIYKMDEYPSLSKTVMLSGEVQRVFFDETHIGIVSTNNDSADPYKLEVYNTSGSMLFSATYDIAYTQIKFDNNNVVLSDASSFALINLRGKTLTKQSVELPLTNLLYTGSRGKYILVSSKFIQYIKLK